MAETRDRPSLVKLTRRLARWEAVALIGAALVLLTSIGWLALWAASWSPRAVLRGDGDTWPLGFTPDGKDFATAGSRGITLWDTATGRTQALWALTDGSRSGLAAFSPDGLACATIDFYGPGSPMAITLRDSIDGRVRWTLPSPNEGAYAILFTAGGKAVRAVLGLRNANWGEVVDVDAASGREISRRRFALANRFGARAVSPDGRLMAFLSGTAVILWNLETDSEFAALVTSAAGATASSAGFSPDGSTLAIGLSNGSIEIWDLAAQKRRTTVDCHKLGVRSVGLQLSRDGRMVVSWGQFRGADSTAGAILDFLSRAIHSGAAARHEVAVVDTLTGERIGVVSGALHPFVSPDGRTLAVRDNSFAIKLFDLPAFGPAGRLQDHRANARSTKP